MNFRIFPPSALNIYRDGLNYLLDEDWLLNKFPKFLNYKIKIGHAPKDIFFKTLREGILLILGNVFFNHQFAIRDELIFCDPKTAYLESYQLLNLLMGSGIERDETILAFLLEIDRVFIIMEETPENRQLSVFHRQGIHFALQDSIDNLENIHKSSINCLRRMYAKNFAERAFHDRQVCEFITFALSNMYGENGYPFLGNDNEIEFSNVRRRNWPTWTSSLLKSRERNICANCGKSFSELQAEPNIDHIVPLSGGGCNDLVNLQLLCFNCNTLKSNGMQLVKSSIPKYLDYQT